MERTTLMLPDETRDRLRRIAADRGVSMATVIREAIDEKVASVRPRPRSIGIGASSVKDTARRSGEQRRAAPVAPSSTRDLYASLTARRRPWGLPPSSKERRSPLVILPESSEVDYWTDGGSIRRDGGCRRHPRWRVSSMT
jgi:hypothetical protein